MNRLAPIVAALVVLAAACGGDDDETSGSSNARTVEIAMSDISFAPDQVEVAAGETVRFVFENEGAVVHDAFIGDETAQADHAEEMRDGAAMHHDGDGEAITVDPGDRGELTYTFGETGSVLIGCHQPGHYDAGMVVEVTVT